MDEKSSKNNTSPAKTQINPKTIIDLSGVEYASVAELSDLINKKGVSSHAIVAHLLNRIDTLDQKGPAIRSIIELNPDALAIADQMDKERLQGRSRGPLHGIPVLVKDNIDTADKMQTSAGSLAMVGDPALKDAFLIQKLRAAGAIILAKNNLSEWAGYRDISISSGWSGRGGQTQNPHLLTQTPCGSSAGSAASVAIGLAPVSVGTETNGSIICPAMKNGVVGMRPTLGLISRNGIVPLTSTQDTAGAIGRNVRDVALLLAALSGADPADPDTKEANTYLADYTLQLNPYGLVGKRIGYVKHTALNLANYDQVMSVLAKQGAILVEMDAAPFDYTIYRDETKILSWNLKKELNAYLNTRRGLPIKSLTDLVAFNKKNEIYHRGKIVPQQLLINAENAVFNEEENLKLKTIYKNKARKSIDFIMEKHKLDAIIEFNTHSSFPPIAGYPGITVPTKMHNDLPTAVYFYGARWSDAKLLSMAYSFEQASLAISKPAFLKMSKSDSAQIPVK